MNNKSPNKPNKVNIRKVAGNVSNIKRESDLSTDERARKIDEIVKAQEFVDNWNNNYVGEKGMDDKILADHFNNIILNDGLIVQMYMENPIKSMVKTTEGKVVSLDYGIQQIDYRKRNTDVATWGPTPFPLIDKGVIVAISPAVQSYYLKMKNEMNQINPAFADMIVVPQVGDVVYTSHFMFKEHRYYIDKQAKCQDFVKSQEELRLNNFDFLFKITNYEIESIVAAGAEDNMLDKKGANIVEVDASLLNQSMIDEQEQSEELDGE